jgi:hypothetical protein
MHMPEIRLGVVYIAFVALTVITGGEGPPSSVGHASSARVGVNDLIKHLLELSVAHRLVRQGSKRVRRL